jgi:hypothetical protein
VENANRIIEANFKQDFSSFPFGHILMIFFQESIAQNQ